MSKKIVLFALMSLVITAASIMLFCSKKPPVSTEEKDFTGTISGIVYSRLTGMPLKGVNVSINADSATPATSNTDGTFEIGKVSEGAHRIHFSHLDYDDDSSVTMTLSKGEEKILDDTVRLSYAFFILKGKVLSIAGGSVVGAGVVCANTANSSMTDDAGKFIIGRIPKTGDNIKLICAKTDCGFNVVSPIRGVADDTTLVPDITLNKTGGIVTGTVYDSLGHPVSGAVVQSVAGGLRDTTGADGSYRIENVPTNENNVSVFVSVNGKSASITGLSVSSGAVVSGMDLRLRQPATSGGGITLAVNDVIVKDTARTITIYAFSTTDTATKIAGYEWFFSSNSTPDTVTVGNEITFSISKLSGASAGSDVQVKVRAKNQLGDYSPEQSFFIKIRSVHPVVTAKVSAFADSAGKDSAVIQINQPAYFTGKATVSFGGIDSLEWDFSDGSAKWTVSDTVANLGHNYDTAGTFKAVFRVRDVEGNMGRDTVVVKVQKPSIPSPLYVFPGNGDTVKTMADSVRIVWHAVSGSSMKYNVYLTSQNTVPGLGDKMISLSTDTSATIAIVKGKRYYWKVEAMSSSAQASGLVWSFVVVSGVPPNRPPVFAVASTNMLDSATVGKPYKDTVSATDADGDTVRYSFKDSVAGMSVGALNGIIQWTPVKADTGKHTVSVLAKDGKGGLDTLIWTIRVIDTVAPNRPPIFTTTPGQMRDSAGTGKLYRDTVHATDPDGDTVRFSFVDSVSGMKLADSIITWTPAIADTGAHSIKIVASDNKGHQVFLSWTITVVPIPVITQEPDSQTVAAGKGFTLQIVATGANLTYQWQKNGQNITSAVAATYSILSASTLNTGSYKCIVCNGSGCDTSRTVQVTVNQPAATIIYVKYNATGANTGASWTGAYTDLQIAIDSAKAGSEIWVAAGTYKPTKQYGGTGERFRAFQMKYNVGIFGGFAGTEALRGQRNFKSDTTVLSGDIGVVGDSSDNCYHVIYNTEDLALTETAVLDGFKVTGGNADGAAPANYGGGMYGKLCSPVIRNCVFTGNFASSNGGGIYLLNSSTLIDSCEITANYGYGGGLCNDNSTTNIRTCVFKNNSGGGGAINNLSSNIKIINCQFIGNRSSVYGYGGGAISCNASSIIISDSYFNLNTSVYDGGAYYSTYGSLNVSNCSFISNSCAARGGAVTMQGTTAIFSNCLFANNFVPGYGGAIFSGSGFNIFNSSFISNTANTADGGGAVYSSSSGAKFRTVNSLFWNNLSGSQLQDFSGIDTTYFQASYCITKQALPNGTGFHISGADPICMPVADNGGPVPTSALDNGSAAIDSGVYLYNDVNDSLMYNLDGKTTYYNLKGQPFTPSGTVTRINAMDARGVVRPQRNGIDIGAFEKE